MTAISKATWEAYSKGDNAGEALAAAIAQDRLERLNQEITETAQLRREDEEHQQARNRAYVAIDVLQLGSTDNGDMEALKSAAKATLLEFLGFESAEKAPDVDFFGEAVAAEPLGKTAVDDESIPPQPAPDGPQPPTHPYPSGDFV